MSSVAQCSVDVSPARIHRNLSTAQLVEAALSRGEGRLASNGALVCLTGDRTGRSPKEKYLEDTPEIHEKIKWGNVNQPLQPEQFDRAVEMAREHLAAQTELFGFDGFVGADPEHSLGVRVVAEQAWHALFAQTLFIPQDSPAAGRRDEWKQDWIVLNAGRRRLTDEEQRYFGTQAPVLIAQSLSRRIVVILGTEYAGEIKKSLFYAMNFDQPEQGVLPMHCSANVANNDPTNVALFFGLSGTGKTTLSADNDRSLIGDDEHGWSPNGIFNFEGGCYAKCIRLTQKGEPEIYQAIRFGSVLENVVIDDTSRAPDFDSDAITENTRATYPIDHIDHAMIPSVGGHPRNVIFLTADAFGVIPPVSRLTREQAMYYFINGFTSKLAGTEAGVTQPTPNFSPCFGGPFLPRRPGAYAEMLAERIDQHGSTVWLINTGWIGGGYGVGHRIELPYTRAIVHAILDGKLDNAEFHTSPIFGLHIPNAVDGVPSHILDPRNSWPDPDACDAQARKLAAMFRENDQKFRMPDSVRNAGPDV